MIFDKKPRDFQPKFEVVTCYLMYKGKFLIVKRSEIELYPHQWCAPGGKIEKQESRKQAVVREIKEETSIDLDIKKIKHLKTLYVRYPEFDFVFSTFRYELDNFPEVILDEEQQEFAWVTPLEAVSYDLVPDEAESIELSLGI